MGAACRLDFLTRLPKPPIYPMPLLLYANYSSGLINSRLFTRDHYLPESRTLADVTVCPKVTRINWQSSVNWHLNLTTKPIHGCFKFNDHRLQDLFVARIIVSITVSTATLGTSSISFRQEYYLSLH